MFYCILIFVLIAVIVIQMFFHAIERRDLYNRIMADDIHEYKELAEAKPERKRRVSRHRQVLNEWRERGNKV